MEEAATNENNSNEGLQPDSDMQQSGPERIPGSSPLPNQPLGDADPGEGAPYSGDDSARTTETAQSAPEYGERATPEYGALKSQYPGWNPYVYGQPEPERKDAETQQHATSANPFTGLHRPSGTGESSNGASSQQAGSNHPGFNPASLNPGGGQSRMSGGKGQPRFLGGVNLDDPNQNPMYGRWDPYAVISFITVFFMALPIFPLIIGIIAIYRTTVFHMKGRGLAIAAVVIAIIELITLAVMMYFGISTDELISMLQSWAASNSGSGTSFSA
ncbi:MAG: hypothetical protein LKI30_01140 [Bifidobacterium crudilactis]|jgi:hypothetical protein|nr:hypothetical protein [Bifidobacterium crudilactis]